MGIGAVEKNMLLILDIIPIRAHTLRSNGTAKRDNVAESELLNRNGSTLPAALLAQMNCNAASLKSI